VVAGVVRKTLLVVRLVVQVEGAEADQHQLVMVLPGQELRGKATPAVLVMPMALLLRLVEVVVDQQQQVQPVRLM
jgi:hypothetical protein